MLSIIIKYYTKKEVVFVILNYFQLKREALLLMILQLFKIKLLKLEVTRWEELRVTSNVTCNILGKIEAVGSG